MCLWRSFFLRNKFHESLCNCKEVFKIHLAQINPKLYGLEIRKLGSSMLEFFSIFFAFIANFFIKSECWGACTVRAHGGLKVVSELWGEDMYQTLT